MVFYRWFCDSNRAAGNHIFIPAFKVQGSQIYFFRCTVSLFYFKKLAWLYVFKSLCFARAWPCNIYLINHVGRADTNFSPQRRTAKTSAGVLIPVDSTANAIFFKSNFDSCTKCRAVTFSALQGQAYPTIVVLAGI